MVRSLVIWMVLGLSLGLCTSFKEKKTYSSVWSLRREIHRVAVFVLPIFFLLGLFLIKI